MFGSALAWAGLEASSLDISPVSLEYADEILIEAVESVTGIGLVLGSPVVESLVVETLVVEISVVESSVVEGTVVESTVLEGTVVESTETSVTLCTM